MVQAVRTFQEEAAVLSSAVGSMEKSAIEYELVDGKHGKTCLSFALIIDVGREAQALVLTLEGLLLVDGDCEDAPVLAEILVAAQSFFFGNIGRQADHVQSVPLQDTNLAQLLLQTLLL